MEVSSTSLQYPGSQTGSDRLASFLGVLLAHDVYLIPTLFLFLSLLEGSSIVEFGILEAKVLYDN